MATIRHSIELAAPHDRVASLVSTSDGLATWWAADVATLPDSTIELGFFDRSTVYRLAPRHKRDAFRWDCQSGQEWSGTSIVFTLQSLGNKTRLLVSHERWAAETPYFVSCNTVWGHLLFRLKEVAEQGEVRPLFTRSGMQP